MCRWRCPRVLLSLLNSAGTRERTHRWTMDGLDQSLLGAEPRLESTPRDGAERRRGGTEAEDIIARSSIGGSTGLGLCLFAMGISSFPVCETLLLQTSTFSGCFKWGPSFYGKATLCLCTDCQTCGFACAVFDPSGLTERASACICCACGRSSARLGHSGGTESARPTIRRRRD